MSSKDQLSGFLPLHVSAAVTTNRYAVHKFISELRTLWKPNGVPVRAAAAAVVAPSDSEGLSA